MPTLPRPAMPRQPPVHRLGAVAAALLVALVAACLPTPGATVRVAISSAPGEELRFAPAQLDVAAGSRVTLSFTNGSTVAHNLVLLLPTETSTSAIVEPGVTDVLEFVAPAAGSYRFVCTVHEGMEGALEVR